MYKIRQFATLSLIILVIATMMGGCAGVQKKRKTAKELYEEGLEALEGRTSFFFFHVTEYEKAEGAFEQIRNRYSFTTYAPLAELKLADIHFMKEEYSDAIAEYTEFVKLHPDHEKIPHALYRLGFSYYKQIDGEDRDQTSTEGALVHFEDLLAKFPESDQAKEVPEKIDFCKETLAGHEFYVGHFYFKNKDYIAAIERLKRALERYPGHGPKEDALLYLGKSYIADGEGRKGKEVLERLLKAFPDSEQATEAAGIINQISN